MLHGHVSKSSAVSYIRVTDPERVSKSSAVSYIRVTDPERLFSMIGKVDTSQRSGLLPSTVRNILSVKIQNL